MKLLRKAEFVSISISGQEEHSVDNRMLYRTVLVEDVGFLEALLAALVTTNRRHLALIARLAETTGAANISRDRSWLPGEDSNLQHFG